MGDCFSGSREKALKYILPFCNLSYPRISIPIAIVSLRNSLQDTQTGKDVYCTAGSVNSEAILAIARISKRIGHGIYLEYTSPQKQQRHHFLISHNLQQLRIENSSASKKWYPPESMG